MAGFTKNDLLYFEKYRWDPIDITEDFTVLDRTNGNHILHFANTYTQRFFPTPLKGDLHKIEYMLAYKVPESLIEKTIIATYINNNW